MKLYLQSAAGVLCLLAAAIAETVEARKKRPPPHDYGWTP